MEKWRNVDKRQNEYVPLIKDGTIICVFDTETTGLDANKDKVIQFSAITYKFNNDEFTKLDELDTFINPHIEIPKFITNINGITQEMADNAPNVEDVFEDIRHFLEDSDVWVGYNVDFDIKMLSAIERDAQKLFIRKKSIDVMEIARDFCPVELKKTNLQTIVEWLGGKDYNFHNSLADVQATAFVFGKLFPILKICYNEDGKEKTHLEKAFFWDNPKKYGQDRVKLILTDGEVGDIYYDMPKHCWSCKQTSSAKRLFNSLDKKDLEYQFMSKYGWRFGRKNPDDVAYAFKKYAKENS